jgi:hypothetical protein
MSCSKEHAQHRAEIAKANMKDLHRRPIRCECLARLRRTEPVDLAAHPSAPGHFSCGPLIER